MSFVVGIPAHNAAATLPQVIAAIRAQPAPDEIVVVDDGSTDETAAVARAAGARVITQEHSGRGAARARIMRETHSPLVLMCDAALEPAPGSIASALRWLDEPRVAAVFGHVTQAPSRTAVDRWRQRHLFKPAPPAEPHRHALLATGLCALLRPAIEQVGGFDPQLRSGEDADLGRRLLAADWEVVADPAVSARSLSHDSIATVLARYARWNSPNGLRGRAWLRQVAYAVKVMARDDLRARDPIAVLFSLAAPFYQLWRR